MRIRPLRHDELQALPPTRRHGSLEISCATFDDPVLYGRLLADAPSSGRCPVLLSDHTLPALGEDRNPIGVLAEVNRRDATAVLADRWPGHLFEVLLLARPRTLRQFAQGLRGAQRWWFWWD